MKPSRGAQAARGALACALTAVVAALAAAAAPARANGRFALVVGNAAYRSAPLDNPLHDARDMAKALSGLGFTVDLLENASQARMLESIRAFGERIGGGGVGLFYFAGHGVQVKGRNFLLPVDQPIEREDDVPYRAVDVGDVLAKMESAGNATNILILDACRNNPFARSSRAIVTGLAQMDAPVGTLIAFATAPGAEAIDGTGGRNGVYTRHLLAQVREPGLRIEEVFKRVRAGVRAETGGRQIPWENTSLEGDFFFVPPAPGGASAAASPDPKAVELAFWSSIRDSRNASDYRAYLERYPNGEFAPLARARAGGAPEPSPSPSKTPRSASTREDALTSGRTTTTGGPSVEQARRERYDGPKARIAVGEFTTMGGPFEALMRRDGQSFGNLGAMLSTALFQTGRFIVVERVRLDVLLAEQNLAAAGRIRPQTATPTGEMEGAELYIVGSVTGYEEDVRNKAWWAGAPGAGAAGDNKTSRVAMDLRLLDARTGRVLAATSVEGTASDRAFGLGALVGGSTRSSAKGPMEMAARKALQAAVDWIVSQTPAHYYHD